MTTRCASWVVGVLAAALGLGCGVISLPADRAWGIVGPGGGAVLNTHGAGVTVPVGAVESALALTVDPVADQQPRPPGLLVGDLYAVHPEGAVFPVAVALTLRVDPALLPAGRTLSEVLVARADVGSGVFEFLPTRVVDAEHVEGQSSRLGVFAPVIALRVDGSRDAGSAGAGDGGACVTSCSGAADGGSDCACTRECAEARYEIECYGEAQLGCACLRDGVQVGVVQVPLCPSAESFMQACGFVTDGGAFDGGVVRDGGAFDGGVVRDGGAFDGGVVRDGGAFDGGVVRDGGAFDGGVVRDGGAFDGGVVRDGGAFDGGGVRDGGPAFDGGRSLDGGRSIDLAGQS
jgi:hypothetical protein